MAVECIRENRKSFGLLNVRIIKLSPSLINMVHYLANQWQHPAAVCTSIHIGIIYIYVYQLYVSSYIYTAIVIVATIVIFASSCYKEEHFVICKQMTD